MTRRTIRRYAHELFPHPDEGETRDLAVEVPYLYARAIGFDTWGTGWHESFAADRPQAEREMAGSRIRHLIDARRLAFLADALHQGLTGQEAWEWADGRAMDESGEWVYDRARRHGIPCDRIKPYPCGPEPAHHDHLASTGDVTGHGIVTRIDCPESECPTCTEEAPNA